MGPSLEVGMLSMGSPRPKTGLVLLSVSINNPKEATHAEISRLSNDIGPLLPAELEVPPWSSPSTLRLARWGSYWFGSFSPSVAFFSLSVPRDEGLKNVCWARGWIEVYKIMKMEIQNQLSPLGKQSGHMYSKDMFISFHQVIFLGIYPMELNLKQQEVIYMKLFIQWNIIIQKY